MRAHTKPQLGANALFQSATEGFDPREIRSRNPLPVGFLTESEGNQAKQPAFAFDV